MNRNPSRVAQAIGVGIFLMGLLSCAPSFNWREVRVEGDELTYLLPCKPGMVQKDVDWGAGAQALTLQGCEVQGVQFTSWASLNGSKQALSESALSPTQEAPGVKIAATLGSAAYFEGKGESGLQVHWAWFTKGDKLYQAGVYHAPQESTKAAQNGGLSQAQKDALETYFESFH
jgi:hypothetical protein